MQYLTFDRSQTLALALVATAELRQPHYVPLADAPAAAGRADQVYLQQMHTVANGAVTGLVAQPRRALVPAQWELLRERG
ncbi:hypothetical protein [Pseudoxanthomonas kaohsiungensis]|uniref:Uncharacterized protein n=1 Tax=Pseudoxanthomonas kaohsiungensis TaxID=283923 RepID=A0ABW3LZU6_9GAMM|nr:hypothetical protein [Pseudoxanthomonas kaohsiungensis]KAF1702891.1 hypothetical protein CSC66_08950 [Pseudoxanthomonas kaohsiungensis]